MSRGKFLGPSISMVPVSMVRKRSAFKPRVKDPKLQVRGRIQSLNTALLL